MQEHAQAAQAAHTKVCRGYGASEERDPGAGTGGGSHEGGSHPL